MLISAGVQAVGGIVQGVTGAIQKGQAKRMMRHNPRPTYKMPTEVRDNTAIATSRAGQGLSDGSRQVYEQDNDRALTASLEAITKNGGSVNNIGAIYSGNQNGRLRLALLDDEMRARNIQGLIAQNNEMAAYKDKEWEVNVFAPYADKAQAAATLAKQGSDNIWKGVNTVGSAVGNYFTGKEYKNEADRVFAETKRVNDAYINDVHDEASRGTKFSDGNGNIYQYGQIINGNAPQMSGSQPPEGGQYNWRNFGNPNTPKRPDTPYGELSRKYPGLMYGKIGYDGPQLEPSEGSQYNWTN
jgi:hypothetical protein